MLLEVFKGLLTLANVHTTNESDHEICLDPLKWWAHDLPMLAPADAHDSCVAGTVGVLVLYRWRNYHEKEELAWRGKR